MYDNFILCIKNQFKHIQTAINDKNTQTNTVSLLQTSHIKTSYDCKNRIQSIKPSG